jgi:hypothetical protein
LSQYLELFIYSELKNDASRPRGVNIASAIMAEEDYRPSKDSGVRKYGFFDSQRFRRPNRLFCRLLNEDISRIAMQERDPASATGRLREAFDRVSRCLTVGPSKRLPLSATSANSLQQLNVEIDPRIELEPEYLGSAFWATGPFKCATSAFISESKTVEPIMYRMDGFSTPFCRLSQHRHTFWVPKCVMAILLS